MPLPFTDGAADIDELPTSRPYTGQAPALPAWAHVAQLGHKSHYGHVALTSELGAPMLRIIIPAVAGDDERLGLEAEVLYVAPASLYSLQVLTEEAVMARRRDQRAWRPYEPRRLLTETVDVVEPGAAATLPAADPPCGEDEDTGDSDTPF